MNKNAYITEKVENPYERFVLEHVQFDEKGHANVKSLHGLAKLLQAFHKEEFPSLADEVALSTANKAFDFIWDNWNLDLSKKDRAKEHFKSKYLTPREKEEEA